MSQMEHNKGKLQPTGIDTEHFSEEDFDTYSENGFVVVDGEIYTVTWDVKRGELYDFANVTTNSDGSINFDIWHHNGGAHWTEVLESKLK